LLIEDNLIIYEKKRVSLTNKAINSDNLCFETPITDCI